MRSEKKKKSPAVKKKRILLAICAIVTVGVLAAGVYLGWYFSPEQKLLRALEAEDLPRVQELYAQVEELPEGFSERLCEKVEELCAQYVAGSLNYASSDQALKVYESLKAKGTETVLSGCRETLETVRLSREAYVKGQSLEAAKDYPAAMESYSQVIEADQWGWQNAQQKILDCRNAYRDQILLEAAALAQEERYTEAMDTLNRGLGVLTEDEALLAQMEVFGLAEEDRQRRELLNQAQTLASAGDYPAAIALLEGAEDEQLYAAWLSLRQEYAETAIADAEEAFRLKGYEEALLILEKCLQTLPENEELLAQKNWYEGYRPVYLSECPLTVSEGSKLYIDQHTQDRQGGVYTHSLAVNKGSVTFQTAGEFTLFTGTVACPKGFEEDAYRTGASIEIYADGVRIYQSAMLGVDSLPKHFSLDITGVQEITVTWICEGPNIWKNWGDRATVFDSAFFRNAE